MQHEMCWERACTLILVIVSLVGPKTRTLTRNSPLALHLCRLYASPKRPSQSTSRDFFPLTSFKLAHVVLSAGLTPTRPSGFARMRVMMVPMRSSGAVMVTRTGA